MPDVIRILSQVWIAIGHVKIEPLHDHNTFCITAHEDVEQEIMHSSPWSIMGFTISTHSWTLASRLTDLLLHLVSVWIQVHGLSRGQMTVANAQ